MTALTLAACAFGALYTVLSSRGVGGIWRALKVVAPLLLAWQARSEPLAAAAFVLSAVGDALLLDKERFLLAGIGAFLCAHLAFVPSLWSGAPPGWTLVYYALVGAVLYALRTRLRGALRVAVPVYALVLATMAAVSAGRGPLGAAGGAVFLVSDALLAVHFFVRPLPGRDGAVLATYYAALVLLSMALSSG
jgi:uncharacterized membrane protein YhhN